MGEVQFVIAVFVVCGILYEGTSYLERNRAGNRQAQRKIRWGMAIPSGIIGYIILSIAEGSVFSGIGLGMVCFALIYIIGPVRAIFSPSMREALQYPEPEEQSEEV